MVGYDSNIFIPQIHAKLAPLHQAWVFLTAQSPTTLGLAPLTGTHVQRLKGWLMRDEALHS